MYFQEVVKASLTCMSSDAGLLLHINLPLSNDHSLYSYTRFRCQFKAKMGITVLPRDRLRL